MPSSQCFLAGRSTSQIGCWGVFEHTASKHCSPSFPGGLLDKHRLPSIGFGVPTKGKFTFGLGYRINQRARGNRSILGQEGGMATGESEERGLASEAARVDRDARIGSGVTHLFPGFNDLFYSDTATCESRFQNGYFNDEDPDPLAYMTLRNQVQLSSYGNCIGHNLQDLNRFISEHLRGAIGSVHLLPIYPSSGDGGFAPIAYTRVAPEMGTWDDVRQIADRFDLCVEFMVNHISPKSDQFKDFIQKGDDSEFAEMFIDWDKFWPKGRPNKEDLTLIRTRKGESPVLEVQMADGTKRRVWCTFGPQQIDINPMSQAGWQFVHESICSLYHKGARVIRLDAFGYFTKKLGTRCFFEEPESWKLLADIEKLVEERGIRLLCEVHEEYETNLKIAARGYWVYDFALPLLVLHAFHFKTAKNLRHWLNICPRRQITVLDTHDGMGIDDITGLATVCETEELKKIAKQASSKDMASITPKYLYDPQSETYVSNPHQINCTYYSACEEDDHLYLLARAIQFFCPGIPLVYYVGMLAGKNDLCLAKKTGSGREINRHRFSFEQAVEEAQRPVVQTLLELCRFRNQHPAFRGKMHVEEDPPGHMLVVTWHNGDAQATLTADLETKAFNIRHTGRDHKEGDDLRVVRFESGGKGAHEDSILGVDVTVRSAPERELEEIVISA